MQPLEQAQKNLQGQDGSSRPVPEFTIKLVLLRFKLISSKFRFEITKKYGKSTTDLFHTTNTIFYKVNLR